MSNNLLFSQFTFSRKLLQQFALAGMLILLAACGSVSDDGSVGDDDDNGNGNGNGGGGGGGENLPLKISTPVPNTYEWGTLTTDSVVYIDRTYTYSDIPSTYMEVQYLQTANDDKISSGNAFLSFTVNKTVDIYVGHANNEDNRPSWLDTWIWTDDILVTTDRTLYLYKKTFNVGTVSLSGNENGGSMYVVLIDDNSNNPGGGIATPSANNDSASTDQTTSINVAVLANDTGLDDAPLTVNIVQAPTSGSTTVENNNTITYTPNGTFVGADTFTYSVTDIDGDMATATVNLAVSSSTGGGTATPFANDDSTSTDQTTTINIAVLTNDTGLDDAPLTVNIVQTPAGGSTTVESNNTITYTPNGTFVGADTFTYSVTDIDGDMATATVNLAVGSSTGGGTATPFANDDSTSTEQTTTINIAVLTNDTGLDDAPLTVNIVQTPAGGSTTVESNNTITYTPNGTFVGADTFTYSVTDIDGDTATATVNLDVNSSTGGGTATPFANDDSISTDQTTAINIAVLANDTGLDDAPLTVNIVQASTGGSAIVEANNTITYTSTETFAGADMFVYSITDADGDMATATVNLTVSCTTCATGVNVKFNWNANPTSDAILGYLVYTGSTLATATMEISNLAVNSSEFNATSPSVSYDAWNDLGLNKGDTLCFRLKAYNETGSSNFSTGICDTIPN